MGTYVHTRFSYNDGDTSYEGVHIPSERWNGWACPSFPLGECVRMLEDMSKDQDDMEIGYRVLDGVIQFEDGTGWQPLAGHVVDGVEVFAVGSWGWVWDTVETPKRPEFAVGFCGECQEWQTATSDDGTGHCEYCRDFIRDCQCDAKCVRCGDEFTVEG